MNISDKIANDMLILIAWKYFVFLNSFCQQRCKPDIIAAMRFTIDDKHLIKWMWVKKYVEKRLLKMFLTEDELMVG